MNLTSAQKLVIKLSVSAGLLLYVFRQINLRELNFLFIRSNGWFILSAFLIYIFSILIGFLRYLTIMRLIGNHLSVNFNLRLFFAGLFYNLTIPGGVGGDGYKIYVLRKQLGFSTKKLIMAMFFDRLSGLWAIFFLASCLLFLIPLKVNLDFLIFTFFFGGSLIYYFVIKYFFCEYSYHFFSIHIKALILQSLQLLSVTLILCAQVFNGKLPPYLLAFLMSSIAAHIPISFSGIGTREYAMILAAKYLEIDVNLAVFLTVSFFLISTLVSLNGLWFIYYRNKSTEDVSTQNSTSESSL